MGKTTEGGVKMEKIRRENWIACADRRPEDGVICLVTDGHDVTVAVADLEWQPMDWDVVGVQGYEWDMSFIPTHWMALSIELPS